MSRRPRRVIVVGGGIAGIAAAVRLAEHGVEVTLLEARRRLGGRASSFVDATSGEELDNCQHVTMGVCVNYVDLLSRLGVVETLAWTREQRWVEAGGRVSVLKPRLLPAPGHFGWSMLWASFLTLAEKAAISRGMLALLTDETMASSAATFGGVLDRLEQPPGARDKFWSPVIVSACNLEVDEVAAVPAVKVFREGLLGSARAASIGLATTPLSRLYEGCQEILSRAGGSVRMGAAAAEVHATEVVTERGERMRGDAVVCALPAEKAARVLCDDRRAIAQRAGASPILGVHLWLDRPVMTWPHAVLVERPTQWLFKKDEQGRYVHAVISAAKGWVDLDEKEIVERVRQDIEECFPKQARSVRVERARAVKERRATFAATPEFEAIRPDPLPAGSRAGEAVVLAGDWTRTDWPATMEGATRSGYLAAGVVLKGEELSVARQMLQPELQTGWWVRWLSGASTL